MPMDWGSILASGVTGAAAGGLVSWLAAATNCQLPGAGPRPIRSPPSDPLDRRSDPHQRAPVPSPCLRIDGS